ncbi:MAG: RNA-binding cell elongation regulator Jag/EloR [Lachnospiraceae bacterium]|nr:RNA-binding cell elongation regulator Jag/EloR [Lachnospiraceae bacterium]
MDFIEVSAKTVDEAITKACIDLGIASDSLDIQVISQGSAGFLGFGSKPAVIKVRKKEEAPAAEPAVKKEQKAVQKQEKIEKPVKAEGKAEKKAVKKEAPAAESQPEKKPVEKIQTVEKSAAENADRPAAESQEANAAKEERLARADRPARAEKSDRGGRGRRNDSRRDFRKESAVKKEAAPKREPVPKKEYIITPKTEEEVASMKAAAEKFLNGVFGVMELPVEIHSEYVTETGCLEINFDGADMGVLIGKRGQTLDSLQYLTSLVVNKEQKEYVRVKLDTEDYRKRRKETLENLAKNIAYKVKRTRKPVSLEPMNPYERRIIHSALQNNKFVETYSEGNEPYRHIVVTPKKYNRD